MLSSNVFSVVSLLVLSIEANTLNYRNGLVPKLDGRIVGGEDTSIEVFPHQISIRWFGSHRCGGTIIKQDVILTAGHCVSGLSILFLSIAAGTSFREGEGIQIAMAETIVHEGFDPFTYYDDIALALLVSGLDFTKVVQPIKMASDGEVLLPGTKAMVTGWGLLKESGSLPDVLQLVNVTVITKEECQKAFEGKNNITYAMFCAGEPTGGRDSCQGDSGGPLVVSGKVYGIVSWGIGCARREYPGVYANIGTLRKWIEEKLATVYKDKKIK